MTRSTSPLPPPDAPGAVDAVVVGAGPNGLTAAVVLAEAGLAVRVVEALATPGGGTRTEEITLPGFAHDLCSAVHPLGAASPVFARLGLERHGLEWVHPEVPLAHPMDGGRAVALHRSLEETVEGLGADGAAWRSLVGRLAEQFDRLVPELLAPLHLPGSPRTALDLARFGLQALRPAAGLARARFASQEARALFAGLAAHSVLPLERLASAAIALVLGAAGHAVGWPSPRGGSQAVADALVARLEELGGAVTCDHAVTSAGDLPPARAYLFDLAPRQLLQIAGDALPATYRRRIARFRHGPGAFKVDYALTEPIPWRADVCRRAGTVHLGGTLGEIAAAEREVWRGEIPERPYVLLGQQSVADPARAPTGHHTAWAYCHVPNGSRLSALEQIESQIERHAPGFRDVVLVRKTRTAAELARYNPACVGGDLGGGVQDLGQLFFRPVARPTPYATPNPRLWLCSSSTPPGGGVHGMCGSWAARRLLGRWETVRRVGGD